MCNSRYNIQACFVMDCKQGEGIVRGAEGKKCVNWLICYLALAGQLCMHECSCDSRLSTQMVRGEDV